MFVGRLFLGLALMGLSGCGLFREGSIAAACNLRVDDPAVKQSARGACRGNGEAALALAMAYERGDKVAAEPAFAAKIYRKLAKGRFQDGTTYIYVPGAGKVQGYVMPITTGPSYFVPGSPVAQYRLGLMYLEGRGVEKDAAKARELLQQAAGQGHREARARMADLDPAWRSRGHPLEYDLRRLLESTPGSN